MTFLHASLGPLFSRCSAVLGLFFFLALSVNEAQADITRFVGEYSGSAQVTSSDGRRTPRDMSVEISQTEEGFRVRWTSVTLRSGGARKEKSYAIDFVPSDRGSVFAAAMRKNVFGHEVPLNPMKGEPYVWARITGDTLTVFSLFVDADGGYSMQQYDRTLAEGGLDLRFQTIRGGEIERAVETFLTKD